MAKLVSRTYGDALFELAVEENRVDELSEEIQVLTEILEQNKDFEKIMVHPEIPQETKLQVIEDVFKGRVSDTLTGFLRIVAAKGRYKELPGIFAYFTARVKERSGGGHLCDSADRSSEAEGRTEASSDNSV